MRIRNNKVSIFFSAMAVFAALGCGRAPTTDEPEPGLRNDGPPTFEVEVEPPANCPAFATAPQPLPGVLPEHEQLDYWFSRLGLQVDLDEVLLSPSEIADHNAALLAYQEDLPLGLYELAEPLDVAPLEVAVNERLTWPLTRRALLEEAFSYVHTPVGWGDQDGGRDGSRFLRDVFESFGLHLPRDSGYQAQSGTFSLDISGVESKAERVLLLESAARRGIVLLHFPGHMMLYLGLNDSGRPMAIHSFAEYLVPCEGSPPLADGSIAETINTVDLVSVSDLELGRHSSTGALIERITRIVVIGQGPGLELRGPAELRSAAPVHVPSSDDCEESDQAAIFLSPRSPNVEQPLRVIVTAEDDPGPVELVLIGPSGERLVPAMTRLGAPPFSFVATIDSPERGNWQAIFGDGTRVEACQTFRVHSAPNLLAARASGPVWEIRNTWGIATENLYNAFVESLFDFPPDEDLTWTSLHELLRDPVRNILYDHLSLDEDETLELQPDCADLPHFLRAYYSWKMGLPYGFRRCSRGAAGRPPTCGELHSNLMERERFGTIEAFDRFINYYVANGVHSGNNRTAPGDDETDYYPVELTPESLPPGTLFAGPHSHTYVVAAWEPQGLNEYGVMIGADAQPDGTVGRRRFWRGSFLFTPSTDDVGAGFKAFRPLVLDPENEALADWVPSDAPGIDSGGDLTAESESAPLDLGEQWLLAPDNSALAHTDVFARYSEQQYQGSVEDFYDAVESLINPRPLDATMMQISLIDALEESLARRLNSVGNCETYMADNGYPTIEMPEGYAIFETTGAWEDYSTPARDMRLLISIDTVMGFPDVVRRTPERFALDDPHQVETVAVEIGALLDENLRSRSFEYTRSDGSNWTLTLQDVVDRTQRFEMAYNPNDCVEIRWSAGEGTDETATCDRRAPAAQIRRMESYREWFESRTRPPR